jgi:FdrA protein
MRGVVLTRVVRGRYLDSVGLMRISRKLSAQAGVTEAAVMIGSDTNKRLMRDSGLLDDAAEAARPADLVVGIKASDAASAEAALGELEAMLAHGASSATSQGLPRMRGLRAATQALPGANLALVSIPGEFAAAEAASALRAGLHVLLFSNNVSLEDERRLKELARERGLLLMGPDCGTSLVNGVPLAFANVVPRGNVGVVAASGTGLQEVTTLIARAGGGISHGIGVGGRDLRDEIGGITTLMALDALDADPATTHIVIISKPPAARVAEAVLGRIARSRKTFTVCLLGRSELALPANARRASTLREAAELALGGTLCAEAQLVLLAARERVASNAPVPGAESNAAQGAHSIVDLGADEFTRGRPHPMIEPAIRNAPLLEALGDAQTGVVLLDVVIGHGADADPAGVVALALASASRVHAPVIASVTGTDADPQVYSRQARTLEGVGVIVAPSNAHAAELALRVLRGA